jgi:hypothetical protein
MFQFPLLSLALLATFFRFPDYFVPREAVSTFVDRLKDQDMKQHLLIGGERSLSEAVNQAL